MFGLVGPFFMGVNRNLKFIFFLSFQINEKNNLIIRFLLTMRIKMFHQIHIFLRV